MILRSALSLAFALTLAGCAAASRGPTAPGRPVQAAVTESVPVDTAAADSVITIPDSTTASVDSAVADTAAAPGLAEKPDSSLLQAAEPDTLQAIEKTDTLVAPADTVPAPIPADTVQAVISPAETARQNPRALRFNGIYLNSGSVANSALMEMYIARAREFALGGFVMDMKDDRGYLTYRSRLPLADKIGANTRRLKNPAALVQKIHENGLRATARVVCFKDPLLSGYSENGAYPFAVLDSATGYPWRQKNGETWANPYFGQVHDYLTGLVAELVEFGFDQVQLDYLRFPSDGVTDNCFYPVAIDSLTKADVIGLFLSRIREVLDTTDVSLAADVFGWVPWLRKDRNYWIGQDWDVIATYADVICPMLYSSHFPESFKNEHGSLRAYNIIREGTEKGVQRKGLRPTGVQPYIQCFDWNEPYFGSEYILQQMQAADSGGAVGWIAWNARNDYSALWEALKGGKGISRTGAE